MKNFSDFIQNMSLADLSLHGPAYTWTKGEDSFTRFYNWYISDLLWMEWILWLSEAGSFTKGFFWP